MSAERASGRSIQACMECRRSKLKCDGMFRADSTCTRCKRRGKKCSWSVTIPGANDGAGGAAADQRDQSVEMNGHHGQNKFGANTDTPMRRPQSSGGPVPMSGTFPSINSPSSVGGFYPTNMSMNLGASGSAPNLAQIASTNTIRSPPIFAAPGTSGGLTSSSTLPPLRSNPSFPYHIQSPLSGTSPRSSGPTPPASTSYRRTLPWANGPVEHATSPRYQQTSWSRRRSRSPERRHERYKSSESSSSKSDHHRQGSASTAPLQHLREVALLSPVAAAESASTAPSSTDPNLPPNVKSPEQVRIDAVHDQMRTLQQKQGWNKERLESASAERRSFFERAVAPEPDAVRNLDPLEKGLLNQDDVDRLFALYYECINTQHCLLDPERDSPVEVRKKSPALFIVICAAASSCDDHPRSRQAMKTLLANMDEAASHLILSNSKSVEVIKAVILSFLFTQKPSRVADDRCWLLVDTAVRTASELGLGHRLRHPHVDIAETDTHSIRSAERAWAIANIMQRSLGTFTGMWALNKLDVDWDKLEAWCNCDLTIAGDVQLVAYLYLRRIEHHTRSQFELIDQEKFLTLESVRVSFNALFDNWRAQWVEHPKMDKVPFSRDFLLTIGLHIQLLLNVTALRLAQGRAPNDGTRVAPANLQDHCVDLAVGLCEHFIAKFQHRAHMLCRNIVSMVTWSALALLQMDATRGHLLALRVALLLAGDANDDLHHNNFPAFYGRWLLSLVNDLAADANARRVDPNAATTVKSSAAQRAATAVAANPSATLPDPRMSVPSLTSSRQPSVSAMDNGGLAEDNVQGTMSPSTQQGYGTMAYGPNGAKTASSNGTMTNGVGADKLLSAMAAPLSSDPFNEAWLNQFLDSLAPASWPTAEDAAALSGSAYLY